MLRPQSPEDSPPSLQCEQSETSSSLPSMNESKTVAGRDPEESLEARVARLGRERPPIFKTAAAEILFVFSISMSQIITEYFVSGFTVIVPTLINDLNIDEAAVVWPATAFSLVIASTLLVFGRLGDMYGGYPVYLFGVAWLLIWSLIAGFSINGLMLDFCRAFQGLGAAAFLPSGVMLMGSAYRPGPRKNIIFAIYGTCAVIGFFIGIFFSGLVAQYTRWGFYFWIGTILAAITLVTSIFSISNDREERMGNGIKMDWWGSITSVCGIILIVFAITESAHTADGWRTPYIPVLFCVGCLSLLGTVYVEGWVVDQPLLPADVFAIRGMVPLLFALMILYGTMGNLLLYGTLLFQQVMNVSPLLVVAWYTPMVVGGLVLAMLEGFLMHLVPGRILLLISCSGAIGTQILLALVPVGGNYWAWVFPAMIMATIGIDLSYTLLTVFVTTQLPKSRQGLGGGLINSVLQLGIALTLGFSDMISSYTKGSEGVEASYKNTFWFGTGLAGLSLILVLIWGTLPTASSDLTADEKAELILIASRPEQQQK